MNKCVVFDFDGVIIDSHEVQKRALKKAVQETCANCEPPYDTFFENSGDSLENIFKKLELPLTAIPIYQKVSRESKEMINVHNGVIQLLEELNGMGIKCALCTGKDRNRTIDILSYLCIEHFFCLVICSDDVKRPKPHPDSLIQIKTKLNLIEKNMIMVGDGINDILCAKALNINSIGVTWGDIPKNKLINVKPTYVANTVWEVRTYIRQIFGES